MIGLPESPGVYPRYPIVGKVGHLQVVETLEDARVDLFQVGVCDVQVPELRQAPQSVGGQVPDPAAVHLEQLESAEAGHAGQSEYLGVFHAQHFELFEKVHGVCRQGFQLWLLKTQ